MDSPTDSSIDDSASNATIKTFDDISIITIPGIETLSEVEKIALFKKAERRLIHGSLDTDALRLRLQSITPPPDKEEDDEESRILESQAREDLERDGCPACYPPYLDIPVQNPPEQYRPIIEYWRSFSSTADVVLCAQRSDWRKFRAFQTRIRGRYRNEQFNIYVDEVHERRRRHGLNNDVYLLLFDSQQQGQQENWVEFQNYHLKHLERLNKKRDGLKTDLDGAQKTAIDTDTEGSKRLAQNENAIQQSLEYTERTLRWHEVLLSWIEQKRLAMDSQPLTPIEEDCGDRNTVPKAARKTSLRQSRSRGLDCSAAVLGMVRVSKPKQKGRITRTQMPKAPKSPPFIVDLGVMTLNNSQEVPKRRETKPRKAKDNPLGLVKPRRVSKAKQPTDAGAKSRPGTQRRSYRGQSRGQSAPQQPHHPTPENVKARSGRRREPPASWAPVKDGICL